MLRASLVEPIPFCLFWQVRDSCSACCFSAVLLLEVSSASLGDPFLSVDSSLVKPASGRRGATERFSLPCSGWCSPVLLGRFCPCGVFSSFGSWQQ